jgi:hypothetical protein
MIPAYQCERCGWQGETPTLADDPLGDKARLSFFYIRAACTRLVPRREDHLCQQTTTPSYAGHSSSWPRK